MFAAAILAVALNSGAGAQTTASLSGLLTDPFGHELADTSITLTNVSTSARYDARSDRAGRFQFARVEPGTYDVSANAPGFTTRYRVDVGAGQALTRDVTVQIGTLQETVTVSSNASASRPPMREIDPQVFEQRSHPCDPSRRGCLEPPVKVRHLSPVYPAGRGDTALVVRLAGRIGVDGFMRDVRLTTPADREFAVAAIDAVSQWRFTPTRLDGVPVEVDMTVTVNFKAGT